MSYRNPQIIVDRSGEIWAKAIANFGGTIASGLDKYAAIKRQANEVTRKRKEANQLVWNKTAQKGYDSINAVSETIKDKTIAEEFIIEAKDMAENGTKNSVVVNGKKYTMGAISAETQINSNASLDKDTVAAYSQIVSNFQGYKKRMIDRGTNIKAGLDPLADSISGDIGNKFDYQGIGPENTKSQIVANTLLDKQIPGVKAKRKYERTSFDKGDKYLDMMRVDAEIDLNSETFKLWKDSGLLSEEDLWIEEGATTGTFSWSRDMDTWGEGGSLITRINPGEQTDEILVTSGFTKENGDITDKGFNTNIIYNNRDVDGGVARRSESHFDPDVLRNDIAYKSQLTAAAKSVLAMPLDQQMKYISGNLEWGTIEQADWSSSKIPEKIAFLEEQRFQKDLDKIVSAKGGAMDTRLATAKDVLEYEKEGLPLEKGDTVYFSSGKEVFTRGLSSGGASGGAGSVTQQIALKKYNDSLKNKSDAVKTAADRGSSLLNNTNSALVNEVIPGYGRVESAELNNGVLEFIYERKTGKRDDDNALVIDRGDAKYDLKDGRQLNTLANQLYKGDKQADKRKAFIKSIQLQLAEEKRSADESTGVMRGKSKTSGATDVIKKLSAQELLKKYGN